jgi:hypothetical protein
MLLVARRVLMMALSQEEARLTCSSMIPESLKLKMLPCRAGMQADELEWSLVRAR